MAESTVVSCPSCGKKYRISPDKLGKTFKCTGCETRFVAAEPAPEVETLESYDDQDAIHTGQGMPSIGMTPPGLPGQVPPPPTAYTSGGVQQQQNTSVMAILSLVFAFFCGMLGIIFGIIGILQTGPGKARGRGLAIGGLVVSCLNVLVIGVGILLPSLNRAREIANRAKCGSNLHNIGMAIIAYQNDYNQQYPPTLTALLTAESATAKASDYICPSSNDTVAASAAQLETGGHCSYKYLYPGRHYKSPAPDDVIAYDNDGDHKKDGANALFGNGRVEFCAPAILQQYITQTMEDQKMYAR